MLASDFEFCFGGKDRESGEWGHTRQGRYPGRYVGQGEDGDVREGVGDWERERGREGGIEAGIARARASEQARERGRERERESARARERRGWIEWVGVGDREEREPERERKRRGGGEG